MWWFKSAPVTTPLLTQATNPADPTSGNINSPNTAILLGDQTYSSGLQYGGRFTLGAWLDCDNTLGLDGNFLFIAPKTVTRSVSTSGAPGSPLLEIPFFDAVAGAETAAILAGPFLGLAISGSATLRISSELEGGEINLVKNLIRNNNFSLTGLAGFRYLRFREDLEFDDSNSIPGVNGSVQDDFFATNNFYGAQIGLRGQYNAGRLFIDTSAKVALGCVNQAVYINGSSTAFNAFNPPFNFTNAPGGIFALPTNIGRHSRNVFGVLPEVDAKIGYNLTRHIQTFVGYNFLYLNNVVRPGTVIDRNLNTTQIPSFVGVPATLVGPPAPVFSFNSSSFWAQGINFGVQFTF
jgi:hypothetical protein